LIDFLSYVAIKVTVRTFGQAEGPMDVKAKGFHEPLNPRA
jgi:hypothetical protein